MNFFNKSNDLTVHVDPDNIGELTNSSLNEAMAAGGLFTVSIMGYGNFAKVWLIEATNEYEALMWAIEEIGEDPEQISNVKQVSNDGYTLYIYGTENKPIETVEYVLPVYWASYLINGDASGITEGEANEADEFLKEIAECNHAEYTNCVDVSDEHWFAHYNDANNMGGDVSTFTFHLNY